VKTGVQSIYKPLKRLDSGFRRNDPKGNYQTFYEVIRVKVVKKVLHQALNDSRKGEKTMFKEFKEFAMRGNVVDMAVGIIIGAAFGTIVTSLVADVIMPPIGLLVGNIDFSNIFAVLKEGKTAGPYASLASAKAAGAVTMNVGVFINTVINFLIVAVAVFLLIRSVNRLQREAAPTSKDCPYCLSSVAIKATRCPHCTSELKAA
jgi:large conductance mechanosensitive channel